jgi:hypothetical protein
MNKKDFELIGDNYNDISEIPKDRDIFYSCLNCGCIIPSVPRGNIGCGCGNIFIDKDYWRLIVADMEKFNVVRKKKKEK